MKSLTNLQERKKDIWAKSPFVKNPTQPAFKVNTETNLWYCFETQQGGNLTDFIKALAKVNITPSKPKRNSEWQPIETAPKDGTNILVYCSDFPEQMVAYYGNGIVTDESCWQSGLCPIHPTHWIPLPKQPKN